MSFEILPHADVKKYYTNYKNPQENAGVDLYLPQDVTIAPGKMVMVDFCVKVATTNRMGFDLRCRSSLFTNERQIILANSVGTIDKGYRGNICAKFANMGTKPVTLEAGTRPIQLVATNLPPAQVKIVDSFEATVRGELGFGSSG